jgi:hypothetical protein
MPKGKKQMMVDFIFDKDKFDMHPYTLFQVKFLNYDCPK